MKEGFSTPEQGLAQVPDSVREAEAAQVEHAKTPRAKQFARALIAVTSIVMGSNALAQESKAGEFELKAGGVPVTAPASAPSEAMKFDWNDPLNPDNAVIIERAKQDRGLKTLDAQREIERMEEARKRLGAKE